MLKNLNNLRELLQQMATIPNQKELRERKLKQITRQRNHYQPIPSIGQIMQDREKKKEENKQQGAKRVSSIELPSAVVQLITGSDYWVRAKTNRYIKLLRTGEVTLKDMLMLADRAKTKRNPAGWFANVMSVARWTRTLDFLKKSTVDIAKKAQAIAERLGVKVSKFIYKQVWHNPRVEWCAVQAEEIGKDRMKLFAWLCMQSAAL